MDWYLEARDPVAVPHLRQEIMTYLEQHATEDSEIGDAELVISELLTNAFEHGAGPAWVSLRWDGQHPVISVADLGPGFPPELIGRHRPGKPSLSPLGKKGRGLLLAAHLARDLAIAARATGGSVVKATLRVTLDPSPAQIPPRRSATPLPALEESVPGGAFDRETFLRALVVQLLQTVELRHGPEAAQATINQVGADVGRQFETEFRATSRLAGRLTPEELATCLIRVNEAIGGQVKITETGTERLVLTVSRCPFGEAVRRAPSLCRMTAGVIGGIATRNVTHGEASVLLAERIAVGDPWCRIEVWLAPGCAAAQTGALHFLAPADPAPGAAVH